ncbi:polysaccharide biosynthesis protein [Metabacillus indicus]|uniref:putative polysaccharide biosynthesis protein n=1 Tax=Metabacillus indicus TaxID=246786 RepID=UPI000492F7E6|nr:polysaccharide biosynthesis protein [Metabacillus indicus]KEZ49639.1 hypothetical protein AZ46_0213210 [Metabacillus indicus LMG 22858]
MNFRSGPAKQIFLQGTIVLTLAALIIKIMSAAYRIPYQNIVGDIGFYIYQQVYPFYGIAIMLATTGFPVIISKMIIEFDGKENQLVNSKILRISFLFLITICTLFFLVLYLGAGRISFIMGDKELEPLVKIISFSFLLVPFISLLRGYFQGKENMLPTALSQVVEQGIRVITILFFSYILITNGYGLYEAGGGALFGSLTGGLTAAVILFIFFSREKKMLTVGNEEAKRNLKTTAIISYLLKHSLTICITSLMIIFIQLVDAMHLYSELLQGGIEANAAKALKGVYDRGQPLIQLGTVVATSFSLSLVPLIAFARKNNNETVIASKIKMSLKICTVVGIGASIGLLMIMEPVNIMLFRNKLGTEVLSILSISVIFTSFSLTLSAILQGLHHTVFPAVTVVLGTIVKLALNIYLVPQYSTSGAAYSTVLAYLFIAVLNAGYLKSKGYLLLSVRDVIKVIFATLIMIVGLYLFLEGFEQIWDGKNRLLATTASLSGALFGGTIYLIAILKLSIFTQKELEAFPGGKKLGAFLK